MQQHQTAYFYKSLRASILLRGPWLSGIATRLHRVGHRFESGRAHLSFMHCVHEIIKKNPKLTLHQRWGNGSIW